MSIIRKKSPLISEWSHKKIIPFSTQILISSYNSPTSRSFAIHVRFHTSEIQRLFECKLYSKHLSSQQTGETTTRIHLRNSFSDRDSLLWWCDKLLPLGFALSLQSGSSSVRRRRSGGRSSHVALGHYRTDQILFQFHSILLLVAAGPNFEQVNVIHEEPDGWWHLVQRQIFHVLVVIEIGVQHRLHLRREAATTTFVLPSSNWRLISVCLLLEDEATFIKT